MITRNLKHFTSVPMVGPMTKTRHAHRFRALISFNWQLALGLDVLWMIGECEASTVRNAVTFAVDVTKWC